MNRLTIATALAFSASVACSKPTPKPEAPDPVTPVTNNTAGQESPPEAAPATMPTSATSVVAPDAGLVKTRVEAARARLSETDAGKLVWSSIEHHGGLDAWLGSGPLHFRFNYKPLSGRPPNDTYQTVSPWSSVARHQLATDSEVEFGWDGQRAWVNPPDADPGTNARFWSLTPYYFVGLPFVLADPGVELTQMEDDTWEDTTYNLVKATFDGVGDAPEDYYILYIHPDTHELDAIRYVVSYPGFRPDGGHGPEKLMSYDGAQTVGGVTFPESHRTFRWNEETGELGEQVTAITVSDVAWKPEVSANYFDVPEGARVIEGWK